MTISPFIKHLFDILADGLTLDEDILSGKLGKTLHRKEPRIDLLIRGEIALTAAVLEDAPTVLKSTDDSYTLEGPGWSEQVEILPEPEFYTSRSRAGVLFADFCVASAGFLDISLERGSPTPDDVLSAAEAAFIAGAVDHVHIACADAKSHDGGAHRVAEHVRKIKSHIDTLVSVDLFPPQRVDEVDHVYACGADAVAYNIGAFSPDALAKAWPGQTRELFLAALRRALEVFPEGAVSSSLWLGMEDATLTKQGVGELAAMGVAPALHVLSPLEQRQLSGAHRLSTDDMLDCFRSLGDNLSKHQLTGGLFAHYNNCRNVAYLALLGFHLGRKKGLFNYVIGKGLALPATKLRRMLRVKSMRDSYESAGL